MVTRALLSAVCSALVFSAPVCADILSEWKEGQAQYARGDFARAQRLFAGVVAASPADVNAQYYLGLAALGCRDYQTARQAMEMVCQLAPAGSVQAKYALKVLSAYGKQMGPPKADAARFSARKEKSMRWDPRVMPLRVCVTRGLELPSEFAARGADTQSAAQALGSNLASQPFLSSLTVAPGYKDNMRQAAIEGVNQWKWAESEGVISFTFVDNVQAADIIVFWTPKLTDHGKTSCTEFDGRQPVDKCAIQLPVETGKSAPAGAAPAMMQTLAAHEFGHALGLWEHSPNASDLMSPHQVVDVYPNGQGIPKPISESDKENLRAIYRQPADVLLTR